MQTDAAGQLSVPRAHSSMSTQSPPRPSEPVGHEQFELDAHAQTLPHCTSPLAHRQLPFTQTASPRQSEFAKQPEVQCRVSGLQPKSPGHAEVVQSAGSVWQLPRLQTSPAGHSRPHEPQLFSSTARSRQLEPHCVVVPAHALPAVNGTQPRVGVAGVGPRAAVDRGGRRLGDDGERLAEPRRVAVSREAAGVALLARDAAGDVRLAELALAALVAAAQAVVGRAGGRSRLTGAGGESENEYPGESKDHAA